MSDNPNDIKDVGAVDPFFTATPTDIVTQRLPDGSVIASRTGFDPKDEPLPSGVVPVAAANFLKKNR